MRKLNINCELAEDGQAALKLLKEKKFHAVLCDIKMPRMSGLECLQNSQARGDNTPFVFITGYGDENKIMQAVRLGAVDFINKPFDNNEIVDVVFRVLEMGIRTRRILQIIQEQDDKLYKNIKKDQKMISLLRVANNKKRTAS